MVRKETPILIMIWIMFRCRFCSDHICYSKADYILLIKRITLNHILLDLLYLNVFSKTKLYLCPIRVDFGQFYLYDRDNQINLKSQIT